MIILVLILSVIVSGLIALSLNNYNRQNLKLLLAFSGAYLLTITVTKLIPEVYRHGSSIEGYYILVGFFIQVLLEYLSKGIEHGHTHEGHKHSLPILSVAAGLYLHSFFEGMPLANSSADYNRALVTGIAMHNIPVGFAFVIMLLQSGIKRTTALMLLIAFSLMAPLGIGVCHLITVSGVVFDTGLWFNRLMAVVIGIFLHISTTILYEAEENHRFNLYKFISLIVGIALASLII